MTVLHLLAFVLFLAYVGRLATRISRRSLTEWWLTSFLLLTGSVILTGFILSYFYQTGHALVWAGSVFITATVLAWVLRQLLPAPQPGFAVGALIRDRLALFRQWFRRLDGFTKALFSVMLATLAVIALTNIVLVLFTVPNEWDSMTGHLNRVVQYIQRGTMRHFGGTNWNMDTYPKSVCTLQIYSFLLTNRFEPAFRFIHHLSYWTVIVAVFGIVQRIGNTRGRTGVPDHGVPDHGVPDHGVPDHGVPDHSEPANALKASLFCGLAYALLPDFLMQAITTETDIVLTAYLSVLLYMLFTYRNVGDTATRPRNQRDSRYLYLAGMAFGIAFGHKITFALLLPSVFVVMIYTVFWSERFSITWSRTWRLGTAIAVAVCLWTLPTGYLKNIEVYGHPIGPPTALRHQSVERAGSPKNLLIQGSRNVVRYAYDHFNLDGIRNLPVGASLNRTMRKPAVWLEEKLHLRLDEETDFSIQPFNFDRRFVFYNANPYWGIFGFALIFPLLMLVLLGSIRSPAHVFLGIALLLHFAALAYSAPYDPFKGRYFIETGLFGIPFLALLFLSPKLDISKPGRVLQKGYVSLVVGLGCVSALLCVFLNIRALPVGWDGRPSVFEMNRMQQIAVGRPDIYTPYHRFDELVPDTATVALGTINDDYEYPLYGEHLTRRLIPINPFEQGVQPIPKTAQYLFFDRSVIKTRPGDIRLGTDTTMNDVIVKAEDYYLRKLK